MAADSESIDNTEKKSKKSNRKKPDDFLTIFGNMFGHINFKLVFILFIIFLFLTSDVFISKFLGPIPGAIDYTDTTTYGTIIQGILLIIFYVIFDLLIQAKVI